MDITFEQAEKRLDELTAILSQGDVPLDEALKLFEEGVALIKYSSELLDKAEQKIKTVGEIK